MRAYAPREWLDREVTEIYKTHAGYADAAWFRKVDTAISVARRIRDYDLANRLKALKSAVTEAK